MPPLTAPTAGIPLPRARVALPALGLRPIHAAAAAVGAVLFVVAIPTGAAWSLGWTVTGEAAALATLAGSAWLRRYRGWSGFAHGAFALGVLAMAAIAFLRQGDGGSASGIGAAVVVPVIAMAVLQLRPQMWIHVGAAALTLGLPILISGAPDYPPAAWRIIVVTTVVAAISGTVITQLLGRAEARAVEAAAARGRLDDAQHLVGLGSWTSNRATGTVEFSDQMYRLLGMAPGAPADSGTFSDHVHPSDQARWRAVVDDLAPGTPLGDVYRVRGDDGATRSLMVRGRVFRDEEGTLRTEGTVLDVSRVADLEAELASTTERLLRLLDSTSEQALMVVDVHGLVSAFNGAAERLTGWPAPAVVGRSPRLLVGSGCPGGADGSGRPRGADDEAGSAWGADDEPGRLPSADDELGRRPPPSGQRRIVASDGGERWINLTVTAVTTRSGDPDGWIGIATDETAARRAAAELEASEARFRIAFEGAPTAMALLAGGAAPDGERIVWANAHLADMTGLAPGAAVGRTLSSLVAPADRGVVDQLRARVGGAPGTRTPPEDVRLQRADGWEVVARVSLAAASGEGGDQLVVQMSDVTASHAARAALAAAADHEREAAEHLRRTDVLRGEFVAMVSHELRTPLTSIAGYVEMLGDGDGGALPAGAVRMLDAVERNTRRLRRLVDDLLTLSRLDEAGGAAPVSEPVALDEVVAEALDAVGAMAEAARVGLRGPAGPTGATLLGDRHQLERAVINVVSNAVKFSPAGGEVRVDAVARAGGVQVVVADSGIGIDAEDLPHLFERFYRSTRSRKLEKPGTGLGLTITKAIVERHGGQLALTSAPGMGTTFRIMLPVHPAGEVEAAAPAPAPGVLVA